jgi:hypothetical protein
MAGSKMKRRRREPKALTEGEGLQLIASITRIINAWEKHAPDKKFGGMTIDDFRK